MILSYTIFYSIFWIIYYIAVGVRDANVIMWKQSTANTELTNEQKLLSKKYSERWQDFGVYTNIFLHLVLTTTVFLIAGNIVSFILLVFLSFSIKLLVHNYCINLFMHINVNHIDADYWAHALLLYLQNKGISQWVFKFVMLIISIVLIILFL